MQTLVVILEPFLAFLLPDIDHGCLALIEALQTWIKRVDNVQKLNA